MSERLPAVPEKRRKLRIPVVCDHCGNHLLDLRFPPLRPSVDEFDRWCRPELSLMRVLPPVATVSCRCGAALPAQGLWLSLKEGEPPVFSREVELPESVIRAFERACGYQQQP